MAKALIFGALACLVASREASAFELGFGFFGGYTYSWVPDALGNEETNGTPIPISQNTSTGAFGFILEQRFPVPQVLLEVFEDFQPIPIQVQTGSSAHTAGYLPVDLGMRLGYGGSSLQPYLGLQLQGLFLTGHPGAGSAPLKQAALGVGGAAGLDVAIFLVRLGFEVRVTETVTGLSPNGASPDPGNVAIIQGLVSLRGSLWL
jgi:hypothetical protein